MQLLTAWAAESEMLRRAKATFFKGKQENLVSILATRYNKKPKPVQA